MLGGKCHLRLTQRKFREVKLTVSVGLRDGWWYESRVVALFAAAVAQLDVSLFEVAQLRGRDGRRGAGWDPRLEAL